MTTAEAEAVTAEIRAGLVLVWEKVTVAYRGRAWVALGYDSWDDYCECEFGAARIRLPREERREVVSSLRDEGLSLRAIAAATGDHYSTVSRELSGVADATPEPGPAPAKPITGVTTGLDGKSYVRAGAGEPAHPARLKAENDAAARRKAEDESALVDLYSGIARGLQILGGYGGYNDIPTLMAEYTPARLDPPQYAREYEPDNLRRVIRFASTLIELQEQNNGRPL